MEIETKIPSPMISSAGWLLLCLGVGFIIFSLYFSWQIFTLRREPPAVFDSLMPEIEEEAPDLEKDLLTEIEARRMLGSSEGIVSQEEINDQMQEALVDVLRQEATLC